MCLCLAMHVDHHRFSLKELEMTTSWPSVRTIQYAAAVWACVLVCTSACFLRNCPTGGKKRSHDDMYAPIVHKREVGLRSLNGYSMDI